MMGMHGCHAWAPASHTCKPTGHGPRPKRGLLYMWCAKHVLRPKLHQRSGSYALNTSKPSDGTVAFKFYGRCKQGLLTSPGWSVPWSGRVRMEG